MKTTTVPRTLAAAALGCSALLVIGVAVAGESSNAEKNRSLVHRYLDEVVSRGDLAVAERLVARDVVFTSPYTPEPIRDLAGFKAMIGGLHEAFPDLRIEEHDAVTEGDRVATRWTATGTNRGPFAGMPPSGKQVRITGMSIYRVKAGKIVEGWVNDDTLGMMVQLGAVQLPAARPAR